MAPNGAGSDKIMASEETNMTPFIWLAVLTITVAVLGQRFWRAARQRRRLAFIEGYRFAPHLRAEVRQAYPHLDAAALNDVERGLRQFFRISLMARGAMVAMPSAVVDELWHALILDTARYQYFCRHAFGRVLHHTPAQVMRARARGAGPLRRAWRLACRDEGLNPRQAAALPLIFALDTALAIADGFHYVPDCKAAASGAWCGNALGCGSTGCAGSAKDSDGGGGDGGDGGGCGGGGD
jgi:hypothetical protein